MEKLENIDKYRPIRLFKNGFYMIGGAKIDYKKLTPELRATLMTKKIYKKNKRIKAKKSAYDTIKTALKPTKVVRKQPKFVTQKFTSEDKLARDQNKLEMDKLGVERFNIENAKLKNDIADKLLDTFKTENKNIRKKAEKMTDKDDLMSIRHDMVEKIKVAKEIAKKVGISEDYIETKGDRTIGIIDNKISRSEDKSKPIISESIADTISKVSDKTYLDDPEKFEQPPIIPVTYKTKVKGERVNVTFDKNAVDMLDGKKKFLLDSITKKDFQTKKESEDLFKELGIWPVPTPKTGSGKEEEIEGCFGYQIDEVLDCLPNYYGAIMQKDLYKTLKEIIEDKPEFFSFVYLIENYRNQGTNHWVAIFYDYEEKEICYYDSFGYDAPIHIKKVIQALPEQLGCECYIKYKYNSVQYQPDESTLCGNYAINYILMRYLGNTHVEASKYNDKKAEAQKEVLFSLV